jgi:hypothetical protein
MNTSATQGRPKQARAPLGGSEVHEVTSVGALAIATQGRPKQARIPLGGSAVHEVTSEGAL